MVHLTDHMGGKTCCSLAVCAHFVQRKVILAYCGHAAAHGSNMPQVFRWCLDAVEHLPRHPRLHQLRHHTRTTRSLDTDREHSGRQLRQQRRQGEEGEGRHLTRGRALSTGKARQGARTNARSRATRHWPFPKARGSNTKHYILPLGMANRMRLRMRMDSQSQSHALSRGGCVLQRSCLSSLAAGQTGGGGLRLPIKLNYV